MASVKAILRTSKKRKDGKSPLAIRVTKDRKTKFIWLKQYVLEENWDEDRGLVKKGNPNAGRINQKILTKLTELNGLLLRLEEQEEHSEAIDIRKALKRREKRQVTFFDLARERLLDYEVNKKFMVRTADRSKIRNIQKFHGGDDLTFREIDISFLKRLRTFLRIDLGHGERNVVNHYILIRTLFNQAIREGVIDRKYYPFGGDGIIIGGPESQKIGLNEYEVKRMEKLVYSKGSNLWHTRNIWLTSFYFAGMRIGDLLKLRWKDVPDGRLYYRMGKNLKMVSLRIPEKAQAILDKYRPKQPADFRLIFNELQQADFTDEFDVYKKVKTAVRRLNRDLKDIARDAKISKNLTNHIARHTFGNISGDKIPIPMLQKLYRHSDIKTTMGYQNNFLYQDTDDALDAVVGF